MTDLSQVSTEALLGTLTERQREGAAELTALREQRDTLNKTIKDKAAEQDKLDRLIKSMTPNKRAPKSAPEAAVEPVAPEPAPSATGGVGNPPPSFQPE